MLTDLLRQRRSYRSFEKTPISRDTVRELMDAASLAPISCNLQLTQYVVVDDPKLQDELRKRVSYKFAYAPTTIVVLYDPRFTTGHKSAVMTAGMQVENMLLRATELGLATCAMAGFGKDAVIKELLNIPAELEILLLVAVGYPAPHVPYPIERLPLEETYRFNKYELGDDILNGSPYLKDHTPQSVIQYRSRISSVYLDRFRLRTYDDGYYEDAFKVFEREVLSRGATSVLDLMSYDGLFLKALAEKHPQLTITAAEYLQHSLDFYASALKVGTARISAANQISAPTCDAISFVFQSDFTPQVEVLIKSAAGHLKDGGVFFVATVEDSWYRRLRAFGKKLVRWVRREEFNIYEGNPFYRIGARSVVSMSQLERYMQAAGCTKTGDIVAASYPSRGTRVRCAIFTKHT